MQQIYKLLLLVVISGVISSCTSTQYIKTGNEYPSLAESDEIEVFTSSKPEQKYETIGLVRIRGGNQEKRIEESKLYAREKGGNGVIVRDIGIITEPGTDEVAEKIGVSTYETQEFVIIKLEGGGAIAKAEITEEAQDTTDFSEIDVPEIDMPDKATTLDYDSMPRATYSQLIRDYESLQGKMFRGSLYPKKIYKIPGRLKEVTDSGDRFVLLTTKSGKSSVYLVVGNDKISAFHNKIKSGEILNFVYSPFNVYSGKAGKQPVIKFVEEIVEAQ
ncbi:MAG: hypothetical protein JXN64_05795 [Spirochaetes bacterium]|nr:hypothetical protein [Spirochaetota bacterium]